jgi:hypothetical protein
MLMVILTSSLKDVNCMRGPHHPRNSEKVHNHPSRDNNPSHNHYLPRANPGEPTPILTHDVKLLHDKE